jgi:AraC-like DNA-binding protein
MYYLCHLFKAVTGFSIKNYLIQYRISRSKDLLVLTSDDMTMVGSACGFQNVNHFIRTFRRLVGITPYQYRKKALMRRPPVSDGSLLRISDLEA